MPAFVDVATILVVVCYLIIFAACLLEALCPKWCWKTFESWKAAEEPSKAYFLGRRAGAIVVMVIMTAIALAPTLIAYFDK